MFDSIDYAALSTVETHNSLGHFEDIHEAEQIGDAVEVRGGIHLSKFTPDDQADIQHLACPAGFVWAIETYRPDAAGDMAFDSRRFAAHPAFC